MNESPRSSDSAIELRDVSMRFGDRSVLDRLNLSVRPREFLVLLGASGCGKSTLVRIVSGLTTPSDGSVWLFGENQSRTPPHKRNVALVSQDASSYEHLSVLENLKTAERLRPSGSGDASSTIESIRNKLIERLELADELSLKPPQLSGGQLQRLAIARAILTGRRIVLYDEPLAHLNESLRQPIRYLIRDLHDEFNQTCIYITHDPVEAMQLGDRIAVLNNGKVEQIDAPELIYDAPKSLAVAEMLSRPPIVYFQELGLGVRPRDWQVESVRLRDSREAMFDAHVTRDSTGVRLVVDKLAVRRVADEWWIRVRVSNSRSATIVLDWKNLRPEWREWLVEREPICTLELFAEHSILNTSS